jgi:Na+/H+-translocating membrane pyrophosphatase
LGQFWTTSAFIAGALTSILAGYVGMRVAVFANGRVCLRTAQSLAHGFETAFRAGAVMGFVLTSLGLIVLLFIMVIFNRAYPNVNVEFISAAAAGSPSVRYQAFVLMYESIAGYGLGGSSIALFGRVGGGIYTKAADVGADLVGKVEEAMDEDSPKNPGTIADNVGDNVGDVAGMGADLFGSFAESSSATLVVAANIEQFKSPMGNARTAMYFPVAITAFGILICLITSFKATMANGLPDSDDKFHAAASK